MFEFHIFHVITLKVIDFQTISCSGDLCNGAGFEFNMVFNDGHCLELIGKVAKLEVKFDREAMKTEKKKPHKV